MLLNSSSDIHDYSTIIWNGHRPTVAVLLQDDRANAY